GPVRRAFFWAKSLILRAHWQPIILGHLAVIRQYDNGAHPTKRPSNEREEVFDRAAWRCHRRFRRRRSGTRHHGCRRNVSVPDLRQVGGGLQGEERRRYELPIDRLRW